MTKTTYQSDFRAKRNPLKIFLIAVLVLFLVALTAGAAWWWWSTRDIDPVVLSEPELVVASNKFEVVQAEPGTPEYQAGAKTIIFTEHELNGLLNHNTSLGDKLKIELATDAIHARIRAELPNDFPVMGGKKVNAKARFTVNTEAGNPAIILDDLTVWGVSLPNDWLASMKGQNLLGTISGDMSDNALARGIKDISIKNGELHIELNE